MKRDSYTDILLADLFIQVLAVGLALLIPKLLFWFLTGGGVWQLISHALYRNAEKGQISIAGRRVHLNGAVFINAVLLIGLGMVVVSSGLVFLLVMVLWPLLVGLGIIWVVLYLLYFSITVRDLARQF